MIKTAFEPLKFIGTCLVVFGFTLLAAWGLCWIYLPTQPSPDHVEVRR